MFEFLKQPYNEHYSRKEKIIATLSIGLFIFLFLFLFKPFGFSQLERSIQLSVSLGYGLVTSFVVFIFVFLFSSLNARKKWTIGGSMLWEFILIICIGIANFFYSMLTFNKDLEFQNIPIYTKYLLYSIWITLLVGIIPVTIRYLIYINRQYKRALKEAAISEVDISPWGDEILITAGNQKNNYSFNPKSIVYISSNDNYITVSTLKGDVVSKIHIRGTLKGVESDLKKNSQFLRCHKYFIVNIMYVDRAVGNIQNTKLILNQTGIEIPVSRTCVPSVLKKIRKD